MIEIMPLAQTIAKNTAFQAIGKFSGIGLSLIVAGLVFRHLGPAGVGKYTIVLAFLQIFGILMDFGLYITLIKKISVIGDTTSAIVNNIFTLRIISGIFFLGLAPFIAIIFSRTNAMYNREIILGISLTTLFYFFISLNQLLSAVFQKFLRTHWIALGEFFGKVALLISTLLVVWFTEGLIWILLTLVISSGVNFMINFLASRKYFKIKLQFNLTIIKKLLLETWPIALSIFFTLIYFKGDVVLLTFFVRNQEIIGWYGAPYKLLEVLITFPAMFAGLILPILSAAWKKQEKERFREMLQKSFNALAVVVCPMIAGVLALTPEIITVIAGPEFSNSNKILQILIFAAGAIFFGTLFGYLVVALNRQKQMLWGYGFVALTSVIGYLIFIPRFSIIGAAGVTVYSEMMVVVISLWIVWHSTGASLKISTLLKCIFSATLMWIIVAIIKEVLPFSNASVATQAILTLAILTPLGAVAYFFFLISMKGVTLQELSSLLKLSKNE